MGELTSCRVCGEANLKPFFDLGLHPLANSLLSSADEKEEKYPLALVWCPKCNLAQLNYTVDPKVLFSHYVWVTGTSKGAQDFSEIFYKELIARTENPKNGSASSPQVGSASTSAMSSVPNGSPRGGYVLEVASNDGTFLKPFKRDGFTVLGIDPAENIVEMANLDGIPTRALFWGSETAKNIKSEHGPAQMIFARNVLAHVAETADFVKGLAECLADDGTLAIEPHYAGKILEGLQYDSIYHEHLCYFTLKPIEYLLNQSGLYVFDILESPISGGAIVVYASKKKKQESVKLKGYREMEEKNKVNTLEAWESFAKRCYEYREKLVAMLAQVQKENKKIIGWGASARSSTLLNFCGIDSAILPTIIDMNPLKQGKFTAGSHILIRSAEEGMRSKPDYIFLTGWNFTKEIMDIAKTKFGYEGSYVIPLPNESRIESSK